MLVIVFASFNHKRKFDIGLIEAWVQYIFNTI